MRSAGAPPTTVAGFVGTVEAYDPVSKQLGHQGCNADRTTGLRYRCCQWRGLRGRRIARAWELRNRHQRSIRPSDQHLEREVSTAYTAGRDRGATFIGLLYAIGGNTGFGNVFAVEAIIRQLIPGPRKHRFPNEASRLQPSMAQFTFREQATAPVTSCRTTQSQTLGTFRHPCQRRLT